MQMPPYVEHIGRMAHALIPITKIDTVIDGHSFGLSGNSVRAALYAYVQEEFGGCTENPLVWGMWRGLREAHVEITVSFKGKEKISGFLEFLSTLCEVMREECVYLEMGEDTYLVRPRNAV